MPTINENFLKLEKNYLFINIAKKVNAFLKEHPEADLIRMGIGDVTLPIAPVCVEAMKKGAHAGNLIKAAASKVGGGGGGRPNMAQAGGKNPAGINDAIETVYAELEKTIK